MLWVFLSVERVCKMSSPGLLLMHQELRTCFKELTVNKCVWDSALADCEPLVSSLGNIAVQLKALKSLQFAHTPLSSFPSFQERLEFKLCVSVDAVLGKLAEKVDALQRVRDAIGQRVSKVFQLYQKHTLDLSACVSRSAICPSVSDMLEWLQDAERHYRLQLVQRRNLLQTLTPNDLQLMETAPERWRSLRSAGAEQRIADALCQVSFFMETE